LKLSWLAPDPTNGDILNYEVCYLKISPASESKNCGDLLGGDQKSKTLTQLGK